MQVRIVGEVDQSGHRQRSVVWPSMVAEAADEIGCAEPFDSLEIDQPGHVALQERAGAAEPARAVASGSASASRAGRRAWRPSGGSRRRRGAAAASSRGREARAGLRAGSRGGARPRASGRAASGASERGRGRPPPRHRPRRRLQAGAANVAGLARFSSCQASARSMRSPASAASRRANSRNSTSPRSKASVSRCSRPWQTGSTTPSRIPTRPGRDRLRPDLIERDAAAVAVERLGGDRDVEDRSGPAKSVDGPGDLAALAAVVGPPPLHLVLGGPGRVVEPQQADRREPVQRPEPFREEGAENLVHPEAVDPSPLGRRVVADHEHVAGFGRMDTAIGIDDRPRRSREDREVPLDRRPPVEAGDAGVHPPGRKRSRSGRGSGHHDHRAGELDPPRPASREPQPRSRRRDRPGPGPGPRRPRRAPRGPPGPAPMRRPRAGVGEPESAPAAHEDRPSNSVSSSVTPCSRRLRSANVDPASGEVGRTLRHRRQGRGPPRPAPPAIRDRRSGRLRPPRRAAAARRAPRVSPAGRRRTSRRASRDRAPELRSIGERDEQRIGRPHDHHRLRCRNRIAEA